MRESEYLLSDGIWLIRNQTCTDATVQHAVVDFAERLGSIERAVIVANLRAIADVIERHAPCVGEAAR